MGGRDYGAVERMGEVEEDKIKVQGRPALPKFIAPVLVLILAGCACVLVSALYRADNQMSQVCGVLALHITGQLTALLEIR